MSDREMPSSDTEPRCPDSARGHNFAKHGLRHLRDGGTEYQYRCACRTLCLDTHDSNARSVSVRYVWEEA